MYKEDYYKILDVDKSSDTTTIKKSYRKLAMKYHPDKNQGDKTAEESFKKINEAYEILSDSKKRELYDLYGHAGVDQAAGASSYSGSNNANFGDIFSDIFGDMFGGKNNQRRESSQRGEDIVYKISLTLEEAILGTEIKINVKTHKSCDNCLSSGLKKGTKQSVCSECSGTGEMRIQQGFFSIRQTCSFCKGFGTLNKNYCDVCIGTGRVPCTKLLSVKVPMGIGSGDKIRLSGEGNAGVLGGGFGDLFIQITIKDHYFFKREDNGDLYCEVPIDIRTAVLGGCVHVPTFFGFVDLKIPKNTQSGDIFTIVGKGVRTEKRIKINGNLVCKIFVEVPVNLNKVQLDSFLCFCDTLDNNTLLNNPIKNDWLKKVENFKIK